MLPDVSLLACFFPLVVVAVRRNKPNGYAYIENTNEKRGKKERQAKPKPLVEGLARHRRQ